MVIEIKADLLKAKVDGIIHQANCMGVMGGGFAAQVARLYPEAALADKKTKPGGKCKLGSFSHVITKDGKRIYNLYSQYRYGVEKRHTDYEAFYNGLNAVENHARLNGVKSLGLPYLIGCGLGGGSWRIVYAIILEIFGNSPVDLYICKYSP